MRTLLVEDDAVSRRFLADLLEASGYQVTAVATAEEAWAAYEERFFPLVVADWLMPAEHRDGLDLCRSIRQHPAGRKTMILVVTVRDQAPDLEAVLDAGADDYLSKPIDPNVFRVRLRIARERLIHRRARESVEAALHISESTLRSVVASAPLAILILDRNAVCTYADGRGLSALGWEPGEVTGQRAGEIFRGAREAETRIAAALQGEEVWGTMDLGDAAFEASYTPLRERNGAIAGVLVIATDVTERRRIQEEVREGEERFRRLSETAFEGLAMIEDRRVIDANQQFADIFGYDREALLGTVTREFLHEEDRPRLRTMIANGDLGPIALRGIRADGSTVEIEVRLRPTHFRGREVMVAAVQDVSEQRRAEEDRQRLEDRLRDAERLESLGVLAGGIAHDFNNLLMGVLGNAGLVLMDVEADSPAVHHIRQIEEAANRAAELTDQMLAFSGQGKFVVEPVNLSDVVDHVRRELDQVVGDRAALVYHLESDLPAVEGDARQLQQVVINLVDNAVDAVCSGGTITISTGVRRLDRESIQSASAMSGNATDDGYRVYLEVEDTGCGMDAGTASRIFEPFFSTKFTGRGLGMAAVVGIARGHDGAVHVRSEPGEGTVVTVFLPPVEQPVALPLPDVDRPPDGSTAGERRTVLVVDDEVAVREVAGAMLEREGYDVLSAGGGTEGVQLFSAHHHDLAAVLLDLTMPDLRGDQVFAEFTRLDPSVPIVIMSGYDEKDVVKRFPQPGLAGFLHKPFGSTALLEALRTARTPGEPPQSRGTTGSTSAS